MDNDLDAAESLIPKANTNFTRKDRMKQPGTDIKDFSTFRSNFKKYYEEKNKTEKENNKFIFKVYLHILGQAIIIFILLFLSFQNQFFHKVLIENNIIFYIVLIVLLAMFIQPLISDNILKNKPQNYFFLFIFTLSLAYCLCKEAVLFDFYLMMIMSLLNIIEILYLAIESYLVKKNEKTETDIANTATFMGLCLLFIGSILCFIKKISIIQFSIILLIIIALGIYIIYDMNCIFIDKRKKFLNNEYVLATMFLYIDIFQTAMELLEKFYNSCEPERKTTSRRTNTKKGMIFTGEEDYSKMYSKEPEEKDKNQINENNINRHLRRRSSSNLQRKLPPIEEKPGIFGEISEEEENEAEDEQGKGKKELSGENKPNEEVNDTDKV